MLCFLCFLCLFPRDDLAKNCSYRCRNGMLATNNYHWSWNHNSFTCVHRSTDVHLGPTWCGCRSSKCICALQVGQCPTAPEVCNFSSESSQDVSDACSWNKATQEWQWYEWVFALMNPMMLWNSHWLAELRMFGCAYFMIMGHWSEDGLVPKRGVGTATNIQSVQLNHERAFPIKDCALRWVPQLLL